MADKRIVDFDLAAPEDINDDTNFLIDGIETLKATLSQLYDFFFADEDLGAVLDRGNVASDDIDMDGNTITGLATPANDSEAATKEYVDDLVSSLSSGMRVLGQTFSASQATNVSASYLISSKWVALKTTAISKLCASIYLPDAGSKLVLGIYSDVSGSPTTLLGQTAEYTTQTEDADSEVILSLQSPVNIVQGTKYWIALIVNSNNIHFFNADINNRATHGIYSALTYTTTLPSTYTSGKTAYVQMTLSALV